MNDHCSSDPIWVRFNFDVAWNANKLWVYHCFGCLVSGVESVMQCRSIGGCFIVRQLDSSVDSREHDKCVRGQWSGVSVCLCRVVFTSTRLGTKGHCNQNVVEGNTTTTTTTSIATLVSLSVTSAEYSDHRSDHTWWSTSKTNGARMRVRVTDWLARVCWRRKRA